MSVFCRNNGRKKTAPAAIITFGLALGVYTLILALRIKPWWNLGLNSAVVVWLYESNRLELFPSLGKKRTRGYLSKHADKILTLGLLFSNILMIVFLAVILLRGDKKRRLSAQSLVMPFRVCPAVSAGKSAVVLFSGGTDSTNTAICAARDYEAIRLITYDRLGFYGMQGSFVNAGKLRDLFKDNDFSHTFIRIDEFYREICYREYARDLFRHGLILLLTCGLCKLAMHWCTILYCLDNKVKTAYDGSNIEMSDPSQNERIIGEMKKLYQKFGIDLRYPVYHKSREEREDNLYALGISERKDIKWTEDTWKIQPSCTQECLCLDYQDYSRFVFYKHNTLLAQGEYEKKMFAFHRRKRDFLLSRVEDYLKGKVRNYSTGRLYED